MWPRGGLPPGALLLLLLLHGPGSDTAAAKKAPIGIEAKFKERITLRLNGSAEAALDHMTARLGIGPYVFSGYELNFNYEAPPPSASSPSPSPALLTDTPKSFKGRRWTHNCMSVDPARDSVENCALRQVYALGALCDSNGYVGRSEVAKELVIRHLEEFATKDVPSLGLHMRKFDGTDIWFHRKTVKSGPDDVDVSPAMQSTVMATVVRCAGAVGKTKYFQDAESWFKGLQKVYPSKMWNASWVGYHKNSIMWESLAIVAESLPKESSFHADVVRHLELFEAQLRELWEADSNLWSFASARALAMRLKGKLRTKRQRTELKAWVREHVDRFLGPKAGSFKGDPLKATERELTEGILARVGRAKYTCGPLQGLVALATVLSDPEIITVVLQLLEKDVGRYQMRTLHENKLQPPFEPELDELDPEVVGGFFRDEAQMDMEKRRSVRVDDTAQCVVALTTVLRSLEGIAGVTVDEGGKEPELPSEAARDPEVIRQAREADAKAQIAAKKKKRAGGAEGRDPEELAAAAEKARQAAAQRRYKEMKAAEAAAAAEDAKPTLTVSPAPPSPPTPSPTASPGADAGAGEPAAGDAAEGKPAAGGLHEDEL